MLRRMAVALSAVMVMTVLAPAATAQTVDEIVAKNYASKGGLEKWKSIQTQKMTGVASAQGFELAMTIYGKRPNMGLQELTIEIPGQPPMMMSNGFDGTRAWMVNPMSGSDAPVEVTGPDAEMVKDQSDFDGALIDYKTKGHTVELVGTEAVAIGTKKAYHLKVTRKDQPAQHFYLDVETGVELKVTTEAGATPSTETELSDYRTVDGVMVPFQIRIVRGGQVQAELRLEKVEFNVPIDDAIFKIRR